jgi:F-type H+-transporting ATPase subunit b
MLGAALLVPVQAHAAAAEGDANLLAPNAGLMFWTVFIFVSVFLILRRYAFKPMTEMVDRRETALREALAAATRDRDDAARVLAEHKAALDASRNESQKIIADGRAVAEKMRASMLEDTKKQQDELLARAKRDIESEKVKAVEDLRREAVDLAIRGAGRVIGKNLDDATNRKIVEDFLGTIGKR